MKNLVFILCVTLGLTACHNYKEDVAQKEKENQDLSTSNTEKDSTIEFFINQVNDIESNLQAIDTSKRNVVENTSNPDLRKTQITRINDNIDNIKKLMKENKERLAALNKRLKSSGVKISGLEKMIATLTSQIEEKDKQLAELNDKIGQLNTTVSNQGARITDLVSQNEATQQIVVEKVNELNTAYYIVGTSKELLDKQVVQKMGLLSRKKVMKSDYTNAGFTQVDVTQTTAIPLDAKDAKVITPHPTNSYTIKHSDKKHVTELDITNPESFWKASKYLIVQVDK
jgi:chromosome segregation ATPase